MMLGLRRFFFNPKVVIVLAATFFGSAQAHAEGGWQCWAQASEKYKIPVDLLYAIARVETGNRGNLISGKNKNNTYDIGLMQINSIHLPRLKKYGINEKMLIEDPCTNLHVGAWILSEFIAKHGYTWQAIDSYNAGRPTKHKTYVNKVYAMHKRILQERKKFSKNRGE